MSTRRIGMSDIVIGQALPWDVYGSDGSLLLRKGFIVTSPNQVSALIERGLFADTGKSDAGLRDGKTVEKASEAPSVVRTINAVRAELRRLVYNLATEADVPAQLISLTKKMGAAVFMAPDVALGCILLNQDDNYGPRHSVDTAVVSLLIARTLKKPADEMLMLGAAALTMNVAMLRQQEKLQEKSETLSASEQQLISEHPETAVRMLRAAGVDNEDWLSWVLHHHENEDGSGYPEKKSSADIPQNAKIISLADRYCARVCARSYRKSMLPNAALRDILVEGKSKIDPMLVTVFIKELGTYPIGTFVKLESGETAVVTGKGATTTTPLVHALLGPRGTPLSMPIRRDTQKPLMGIREVLHRDQVPVKFTMRHLWGDIARL
ncbi:MULTISPECIES: HD-GYP domain-containing protein [Undibacterium]|jgi:HD-GYP domain-containing protein (c-di-GMP phosphodiesterase class II)|uniref:HD-GYP domain-containing protein n=1 Tax=Undibacterium TaxID=401469 RepID=UPI001E449AB7|nr:MULTISPECIES: HD domain-containing phosphohydrolase [Undibacterium]MDP1977372.1 HD domain-containing phosphohydrolase [Undibacterium sp.]